MNFLKGWFGEKKTTFNMWLSLDANTYQRFHDLIIPSSNGSTQIDHLLISPYGVFIVETKNLKGWIFGSENQPKWTQSLYGKKYSFQNPLRQTYRQKKILSKHLGIDEATIHTVIYFVGDSIFKTPLPANVLSSDLGSHIKSFRHRILSTAEINRILERLHQHVSQTTLSTRDHVASLHQRHHSNTTCPKCGSALVERTAKRGSKAGSTFLGCQSYPKCRFTKNT